MIFPVKKFRCALIFSLSVAVASCGGGKSESNSSAQEVAIETIANYAKNAGLAPTLQNYIKAGVNGVNAENLEKINNKIFELTYEDVDSKEEIQAILDELGIDIPDILAPVITLNGANPITLIAGDKYIEAGASAVDDKDDHVEVKIAGSVDANTVGIYTITYTAKDKAGNTSSIERIVKVVSETTPDTTKPIITLYGLNPVVVLKDGTYIEAGATAVDDRDGEVVVTITGEVNTEKLGAYKVTYTAIDKNNNTASQTRTVNVVINDTTPADTTKPVMNLNGNATITLTKGDTYTEAGATAVDDRDGIVTVEITGEVNTNIVGHYTVKYTAEDKAKNKATATRTVDVQEQACAQVITHAYNPETHEEQDFATPCDVPDGWIVGIPPVEEDTTPPVIIRLGSESVNITVGDVYNDAGATATDNKDGDITDNIGTHNPVNTAVANTYMVTYNVDDAAGNHALQVTRSVTVSPIVNRVYGVGGASAIAPAVEEPVNGNSVIIMPEGVSAANPVPVVFVAPGFRNTDYTSYQTLLNFIASHGYAAIFAKDIDGFSANSIMTHLKEMVENPAIEPLLDTSRIGLIGHSSGGGHIFRILKEFSNDDGWGVNGRFLLALEPWFAFDMTENDMKTLPSNSNIVIQQYGEGGNNLESGTDARTALTEYYLLNSIANNKKDYQIFDDADHLYPYGNVAYSEMQGILKPLDGLMEFTFKQTPDAGAQQVALEVGNDDPYDDGHGIQVVKLIGDYGYPCHGANTIINYCAITQGALPPESGFAGIARNDKSKPDAVGVSYVGEAFGKKITRFTDRTNETYNDHPYSKTQAWNSDMTMIRMSYRWYDAETLQELPITSGTDNGSELYYINGGLSEKKWSNINPNVFYGVSGSKFKKGTINAARDEIINELVHDFTPEEGSYDKFTLGKYEGNIDYNDKYVVFAARKTGENYLTAIVYDIQNNSVRQKLDFTEVSWPDDAPQVFDWMSVSALGSHILISTGGKVDQYDLDLNFVRQLSSAAGHGDLGVDQNGGEVYVQYEYGANSGIWIYRLSDGYRIRLLPDKYNGGHLSCRNYNRRGWCYASTNSQTYREVFAIKLDYSGPDNHIVNRFAQTHDSGNHSMVNASPDGKRVLFMSNWGDTTIPWEDKDTYIVK